MQISYKTRKLAKLCASENELIKTYGFDSARKIGKRLSALRAALHLGQLRNAPGHWHGLDGARKDQVACEVGGGLRLVVDTGGDVDGTGQRLNWSAIVEVVVIEITDYH